MNIEAELSKLAPQRDTALTIGVFDGVHIGHGQLVEKVKEDARRNGLLACVMTFDRHPQQVLCPDCQMSFLTTTDEKLNLLKGLGADMVVALPFTRETAQLGARRFVTLLKKYLRMRTLVIGPDFALGRNREGDASQLGSLSVEMGFNLIAQSQVILDGEVVSSTAIRAALAAGEIGKVNRMLGRPYSVSGRVEPGAERGRTMGFPTANLSIDLEKALPPDGVYVTLAHFDGSAYASVTNVGPCPTFESGKFCVEVHVLDFRGDLYGKPLRIEVLERLRGETKFASADELKAQIARDVERARAALSVRK